jgi:hypothetical protein
MNRGRATSNAGSRRPSLPRSRRRSSNQVLCRRTLCRVDAMHPDDAAMQQWRTRFNAVEKGLPSTVTMPTTEAGGSVRTTTFLIKKGILSPAATGDEACARDAYPLKPSAQRKQPAQFLARLGALISPPRHPLIRFYGVFAPHSSWQRRSYRRARDATTKARSPADHRRHPPSCISIAPRRQDRAAKASKGASLADFSRGSWPSPTTANLFFQDCSSRV